MEDTLLTVKEVAIALHVDETTVWRWIVGGMLEAVVLPHVRKRRPYRVKQSVLDGILNGARIQ